VKPEKPTVLSIIELGGYPDFSSLYQRLGFHNVVMPSMRKALKYIRKQKPDVIIAEFNFQSDFRDRSSQLETLMASIAQSPEVEVIVLYDREQSHQLDKVTSRFSFAATLSYPINEDLLRKTLQEIGVRQDSRQ
jgi:DNA-binding NarL/FixJ family response regulator